VPIKGLISFPCFNTEKDQILKRLAVDGDHVGNFGVGQRVGFDLPEPPHPRYYVGALEDERDRCSSFGDKVAYDSAQRTKQRRTSMTTDVENSPLCNSPSIMITVIFRSRSRYQRGRSCTKIIGDLVSSFMFIIDDGAKFCGAVVARTSVFRLASFLCAALAMYS